MKKDVYDNLTSNHIQIVLDSLLYSSLQYIITKTPYIDDYVSGILVWCSANTRAKISSISKEKQLTYLFNYVCSSNPKHKFYFYKKVMLDRGITCWFISSFLNSVDGYTESYVRKVTKKSINDRDYGLSSAIADKLRIHENHLFTGILNVRDWFSKFISFRNSLLVEYKSLAYQQASMYKNINKNCDIDDLAQNYMRAMIKAFNKFDSRKGALTSYIKMWMLHTSQYYTDHSYNISYTTPYSNKNTSNLAIELSEELHTDYSYTQVQVANSDRYSNLLKLLQKLDPYGIVRLQLDIEEYISEEHITKMKEQMKLENIPNNL